MKDFRKCLIVFSLAIVTILISSWYATPISEEEVIVKPEPIEHIELSSRSEDAIAEQADRWKSLGEFTLTAYCSCSSCCGKWANNRPIDEHGNEIVYTSTGSVAKAGRTIAIDPSVIPYGTKVKIGDTIYTAEDTGGAIKKNRIDVYHDDHQSALKFGKQKKEVFILVEE